MITNRRLAGLCLAITLAVTTSAALAAPAIHQVIAAGQAPASGQVGSPVLIFASGLTGSVSVFFSNGTTPSVAATPVTLDSTRGIVSVRVPASAATGSMKVRASGVDSPLFYFRIEPGSFTQGTDVLSGQVTDDGAGVSGAFVVMIKSTGCDDSAVWDYTTTSGGGNYTLHGTDGDYFMFVIPPVSSGLAGTGGMATLGGTPAVANFPLIAGTQVTGKVVNASAPSSGIGGSRVEIEGDAFESVLSDANGNFSARVNPGEYKMTVTPGTSTFAWARQTLLVGETTPQALGNVEMATGVTISGTVTRASDGSPLPGAEISAQLAVGGGENDPDKKRVRGDGSYTLVVPQNQTYRIQVELDETSAFFDVVDEALEVGSSNVVQDLTAADAAIITGTVTGVSGGAPIGGVDVQADETSTPIGSSAASGSSCQDGSYRLRVPPSESGYFVMAGATNNSVYTTVTWNNTESGTYYRCEGVRVSAPTAGLTTSGVNLRVEEGASIQGAVTSASSECSAGTGGLVVVDDGQEHECSAGSYDYNVSEGSYRIYGLPPSTVVEALRACVTQPGFDPQCWNQKTSETFDGIVVAPGGSQQGIDFCLANCQPQTWYHDGDEDGYGNPNVTQVACLRPDGYLASAGDCDDAIATIHPEAQEVCANQVDEDCDGSTDEPGCLGPCPDSDGDLYAACSGECGPSVGTQCGDCDDENAGIHPGAADTSCNNVDENCSGDADEGYVSQPTECGVGACASTGTTSCVDGEVLDSCAPGLPGPDDTTCDNVDDDCSGLADDDYAPLPTSCGVGACARTGTTSCVGGQASDTCVAGSPVTELCDDLDNDCDGSTDEPCPMLLLPADEAAYTILDLPPILTWSPGQQAFFQVQISNGNDPFTPVVLSKKAFKAGTSWKVSKKVWKNLKILGAGGNPLYWRVVGKTSKKSLITIVSEARSFSFAVP